MFPILINYVISWVMQSCSVSRCFCLGSDVWWVGVVWASAVGTVVMLASKRHSVRCHLFLSARRLSPSSNCLNMDSAASLLMPAMGWLQLHVLEPKELHCPRIRYCKHMLSGKPFVFSPHLLEMPASFSRSRSTFPRFCLNLHRILLVANRWGWFV